MDLHSAAATIEQVLSLAQRRERSRRPAATDREADRLANQAALEQVDHLLMDYWDALDDIAAGRKSASPTAGPVEHVWELGSGVRIAQSPSEALSRVGRLADAALREADAPTRESDRQAVRWLAEFVRRHGARLDHLSAT